MTQATLDFNSTLRSPTPPPPTPVSVAVKQGLAKAKACCEATRREVYTDWPEKAESAIMLFINQQKIYNHGAMFHAEQAREYCYSHGLARPHDDRAFGSVFLKLVKKGIIVKTDFTYKRTRGHGSPAFYWRIV